jgi:cell division protein FtsI/penicillin-binding protein 2
VFGLTGKWDIGLGDPTAYWSLPTPAGNDQFGEDLIGQGNLTIEPLALASVAATASTGAFHLPVIVPGTPQRAAARTAPRASLRAMMRQVVTGGTATTLTGLRGDVGAKTGTGDVGGGNANWVIAYRDDLAVACLVQGLDQSRGNATAGPVVARLFQAI